MARHPRPTSRAPTPEVSTPASAGVFLAGSARISHHPSSDPQPRPWRAVFWDASLGARIYPQCRRLLIELVGPSRDRRRAGARFSNAHRLSMCADSSPKQVRRSQKQAALTSWDAMCAGQGDFRAIARSRRKSRSAPRALAPCRRFSRAGSSLIASKPPLYVFVLPRFPSRQMMPSGSKALLAAVTRRTAVSGLRYGCRGRRKRGELSNYRQDADGLAGCPGGVAGH